jgi:hypothetical protein
MNKNLINWKEIYNDPALFHIYLTERKRGKTDTKAWAFLETIITPNNNQRFAWLRRHWHDSLECTKPYFQDLVYKFCEEKELSPNSFDIQEQGLFYQGKKRIYFFDLFSFRKARGKIARGVIFSEIVYEEAIPIDQEVLPKEQWKLKDFIESLKREDKPLKITFLANPYIFSMYFLDEFGQNSTDIFALKKQAEELVKENKNEGIKAHSKDKKWFLYLNLLPGKPDPHSLALEEKQNPSLRNWDDFMISLYNKQGKIKKYQILHAIQDYYFVELGEREKKKKYALMHFIKNKKETNQELVNFCFDREEVAKSKLKNCVLRDKPVLIMKWIKMLKNEMLYFTDFKSRDWFLEQLRVKSNG